MSTRGKKMIAKPKKVAAPAESEVYVKVPLAEYLRMKRALGEELELTVGSGNMGGSGVGVSVATEEVPKWVKNVGEAKAVKEPERASSGESSLIVEAVEVPVKTGPSTRGPKLGKGGREDRSDLPVTWKEDLEEKMRGFGEAKANKRGADRLRSFHGRNSGLVDANGHYPDELESVVNRLKGYGGQWSTGSRHKYQRMAMDELRALQLALEWREKRGIKPAKGKSVVGSSKSAGL